MTNTYSIYTVFTQTCCTRHLHYGKVKALAIWFKIQLHVQRNTWNHLVFDVALARWSWKLISNLDDLIIKPSCHWKQMWAQFLESWTALWGRGKGKREDQSREYEHLNAHHWVMSARDKSESFTYYLFTPTEHHVTCRGHRRRGHRNPEMYGVKQS